MKKVLTLLILLFVFSLSAHGQSLPISVAQITETENGHTLKINAEDGIKLIFAYYDENDVLIGTEFNKSQVSISKGMKKINVYGVSLNGECYILKIQIPKTVPADSFVVHSKWNEGFKHDIYPYFKDGVYYLFMPSGVNRGNIVYTTYKDRSIVKSYSFDFTDTDTCYVNLGYERYKVVLMESYIPSVSIDINDEFGTIDDVHSSPDHSVYAYGDLKISVPKAYAEEKGIETVFESVENDETSPMTMEIRGRGHTSWTNAQNGKYPYQIKLEKKESLLGMDKSKKWILLKDDVDIYRNALAFDMADLMGLEFTPQYEFVNLFINGEYKGIYILCEKIEVSEGRVDIPDLDKKGNTEITGGYLLEIANGPDELQFESQKNNITIKSPEKLDETVSESNKYGYIVKDVRYLMDSIYKNAAVPIYGHFIDHIDTKSFCMYFWHQEFFGNLDAGSGSTYFYKLPQSMGGLYYMGPVWDNDYTFPEIDGWVVPNLNRGNYENGDPTIFKALLKNEEFNNWAVSIFETENVGKILKETNSLLKKYEEKTYLSVLMNDVKFENGNLLKLENLKTITQKRAEWLIKNYKSLSEFVMKVEEN